MRSTRLPHITVVVVTYNSEPVVADCLRSLPAAFEGTATSSVVVVDNASTDNTVNMVRIAAPHAAVHTCPENRGFAAGINAGVSLIDSESDAVLVLNPDIRLNPGSIGALLAGLARPGIGIAVPRLEDAAGDLQYSLRREPTVLRALGEAVLGGNRAGRFQALGETVSNPATYRHDADVSWATGAAMLISRACLESVGPWDEAFFLYSEETDFALRAADQGLRVRYVADAHAVHLGGESNTSPKLWTLLTVNRVQQYRRRHGALRSAAFRCAVILNEALRALRHDTNAAALRGLLRRSEREANDGARAGRGYICFSAQDWWYFSHGHSDFQYLRRIAEQCPVLFVNSLGMRMPLPGRSEQTTRRVARKARSVLHYLRRPLPDVPGFHVLTPLFLPVYGEGTLRRMSARFVRWQVRRIARHIGIRDARIVVTLPTAWDVVEKLPRRSLVFYRSDRYSAFGEADTSWVAQCEQNLMKAADVVAYSSRALLEEEGADARRAAFLDHGVDLEHFSPNGTEAEPPDIAAIARPRVGFFGGIDDYVVDLDLIEHVAREMPDVQVVLIGAATCPMRRFDALPNVHWLGARPYEEIPRYGRAFDVAIMPWLDNEWIAYSNPIKMKEYLALGLPVVSTNFPEARYYRDVMRVADDAAGFVTCIRDALHDGPEAAAARRRAVESSSWDQQAELLMAICELDDERGAQTCAAS